MFLSLSHSTWPGAYIFDLFLKFEKFSNDETNTSYNYLWLSSSLNNSNHDFFLEKTQKRFFVQINKEEEEVEEKMFWPRSCIHGGCSIHDFFCFVFSTGHHHQQKFNSNRSSNENHQFFFSLTENDQWKQMKIFFL